MIDKKTKFASGLGLVISSLLLGNSATAATIGNTEVKYSGYLKADAILSNYSDGTLPTQNIGRDFYIPSLTPVGGAEEGTQLDAHIRQSRFRFTTATPVDGKTLTGALEFDMLVTPVGDDRISNSYVPRIRHAYIQYGEWMVGQNWTNFMDTGALPETLDFIGTTDGIIFARQPQVRYTSGAISVSLENPETTVSRSVAEGGGRVVADDSYLPDIVAKYTSKGDWGHVAVAGMVRQLNYEQGAVDDSATSYGISVTGKIKVGAADDIRFSVNTGTGLGRYAALNAANGAVVDQNNGLETIDTTGYAIAYRRVWSDKYRSSFTFSAFSADHEDAITTGGATKDTYSMRANLIYQLNSKIIIGAEYAYANREVQSGLEGDMNRFQFSTKYSF